nr:aldehyde dehydrogenase family 2 member C4 [Tanacetum cinerariifolium]
MISVYNDLLPSMAANFGAKIIPSGVVGEDDIGKFISFGMVLPTCSLQRLHRLKLVAALWSTSLLNKLPLH